MEIGGIVKCIVLSTVYLSVHVLSFISDPSLFYQCNFRQQIRHAQLPYVRLRTSVNIVSCENCAVKNLFHLKTRQL